MDTSSHICMGVATGLSVATIATNNNIEVATASVVTLSVIANVFPDIDVLFKLKSNYSYINYHRAFSHSILFAILWIILLSTSAYFLNNQENYYLYLIVATLGISLHIFTDLLNGYGVQFLWPFKKKWIALGLTYTFDAFLFIIHIISFILIFYFNTPVLITFTIMYLILGIYIFIAFIYHYYLKKQLIIKYGKFKRLILQSKSTPFKWKYVYETYDKKFYMGIVNKKTIIQLRYERRQEVLSPQLEVILLENKDVKAFIDFTPIFNYTITHNEDDSIDIKFYDLRYLMVKKNQQFYSFHCIVKVKDNTILKSYIGFVVSQGSEEKKFEKLNHDLT